jgi:hypothetical protein
MNPLRAIFENFVKVVLGVILAIGVWKYIWRTGMILILGPFAVLFLASIIARLVLDYKKRKNQRTSRIETGV